MDQSQNKVASISDSGLPPFMSHGLAIAVTDEGIETNVPGITYDSDKSVDEFGLSLSQYLLSHYHPDAGHEKNVIQSFYDDCIKELLTHGGNVPHASARDWLFYHDQHNAIVDE